MKTKKKPPRTRADKIAPTSRRDFTRLLRGLRVNRELTVRDVAQAMGTSVERVTAIENGSDIFLSELQLYVSVLGYELTLEKAPHSPRQAHE